MKPIIYQYGWFRRLLCRLGIHSFRDEIFGDWDIPLPVNGISGYCYPPKKRTTTGEHWRFRECKYCKWGEFKRPLRDINEEQKQFDDFSNSLSPTKTEKQ